MNLKELKQPYEQYLNSYGINVKKEKLNDVADCYANGEDKDKNISILVIGAWQSLQREFYKQENTSVSAEELYDLYLDAIQYVIEHRVWHNKENKLYGDENAFIKAVTTTLHSRFLNYVHAMHRQKRFADYNPLSMDSFEEDFQEGILSPYFQTYDVYGSELNSLIKELFEKKKYVASFILDAILNLNIYKQEDDYTVMDIRKLRKHLRHIDESFCLHFADVYGINKEQCINSIKYFVNLSSDSMDNLIDMYIKEFRNNSTIRKVVGIC